MPYYTRPDGTREIELPSGRRIVTMMSPEELQAKGIMPAQMSGGETPMSMQPTTGPRTIRMRGPNDAQLSRQLDAVQAPEFAPGPSPAVTAVQRQIDAQRVPTARFADYESPEEEKGQRSASTQEGGATVDREQEYLDRRIKELEDELSRLRDRRSAKKG